MRTRHVTLAIIFLLSVSCVAFADRTLDRAEILQIFQTLTSQPRKTWIPAGEIEATHEEYRAPKSTDNNYIDGQINKKIREYQNDPNKLELAESLRKMRLDAVPFNVRYRLSNKYTMSSTVLVRYDGDRFYWEINVDSRKDSVKLPRDLAGNFMTEQFDLNWNARRIFAWDGETYTTYFLPGNHAIVDSTGSTPHVVNGPLTAGIIPWGYGYYTYEQLSAIESLAVEKYVYGGTQIHLTLNNSDGSEMLYVMDPGKGYAVISCLVKGPDTTILKQYDNYQLVSGEWVPTTILMNRYDAKSNSLLASDLWNFTWISGDAPAPESFAVEYEADALIEYCSYITDRPAMYRYSQTVNTDLLLAERLTTAASEGVRAQNCATIAMKYVASRLGKDTTGRQLAQLVSDPDKTTSLYAMKKFAQGLGLYCRAVKTDIQTLEGLEGCEAVLHIPGKKHFVVLEAIDDKYVWTIDLASNNFYYSTDINFFDMDWAEGVALLVSNSPITGEFADINDDELQTIIGASGYSCTRLLQTYNVIYCEYVGGECLGNYQVYFTRYGCETAESGSCRSYVMLRCMVGPCVEKIGDPFACEVLEWTSYYMRACK